MQPITRFEIAALEAWRDLRILPHEKWIQAFLANDLHFTLATAPSGVLTRLPGVLAWIFDNLPAESWGDRDRVRAWHSRTTTTTGGSTNA